MTMSFEQWMYDQHGICFAAPTWTQYLAQFPDSLKYWMDIYNTTLVKESKPAPRIINRKVVPQV